MICAQKRVPAVAGFPGKKLVVNGVAASPHESAFLGAAMWLALASEGDSVPHMCGPSAAPSGGCVCKVEQRALLKSSTCASCLAVQTTLKCGGCRRRSYCSKECQAKQHTDHKVVCGAVLYYVRRHADSREKTRKEMAGGGPPPE